MRNLKDVEPRTKTKQNYAKWIAGLYSLFTRVSFCELHDFLKSRVKAQRGEKLIATHPETNPSIPPTHLPFILVGFEPLSPPWRDEVVSMWAEAHGRFITLLLCACNSILTTSSQDAKTLSRRTQLPPINSKLETFFNRQVTFISANLFSQQLWDITASFFNFQCSHMATDAHKHTYNHTIIKWIIPKLMGCGDNKDQT